MCGITGFLSKKYNSKDLQKITDSLYHRGPDADGIFFDENNGIGLGHRRLSILDLSTNANQPFYSVCDRYVLVYNGEIYNFEAIYNELKKETGFERKTVSDTEIILEAFVHWGDDFINKLNGMFAFAIWDKNNNELKLFRDRIGIKPLYYYWVDNVFAFSSEIKGLTQLITKSKLTINRNSIYDILHLGYTPQNFTAFNEIKKVPSGSFLKVKDKEILITKFWNLNKQIKTEIIKDEFVAKKGLEDRLKLAVEKQMISDVPLGTFLSGGVDSSLVTALAQKMSSNPINTFSIGFKDDKFDESRYAKKIAQELRTNHHEFILTEKEAIEQVDNLLSIYDEPFGDSSSIPTLLVSKMAKKHVSVALSGDGGDEQFLGYGMYQWAKRMNNPVIFRLRKPIYKALNLTGNNRIKRGALVINALSKTNLKAHIFSQEQGFFSALEIDKLLVSSIKGNFLEENWTLDRELDPMENQALFDLHYYLKEDLLVKVDRASMHHSLEVRVPLLDHEIVSYSLNIDPSLKYKNGISKYLLKEVLYDYLPKKLFVRPKKGFSIPLSKWLKKELKYLIDQNLSKVSIESCGLVNFHVVNGLVNRFLNGEDYLYNRLWILIQIHQFYLSLTKTKS
jgi:asparagine synthase (glutamine-hydrolysing)